MFGCVGVCGNTGDGQRNAATDGVGHVTNPLCTCEQAVELIGLAVDGRVDLNLRKAGAVVGAGHVDVNVRNVQIALACGVGESQCETRRHRSQEQVGRLGSKVCSTGYRLGFVDVDLEFASRHITAPLTEPGPADRSFRCH